MAPTSRAASISANRIRSPTARRKTARRSQRKPALQAPPLLPAPSATNYCHAAGCDLPKTVMAATWILGLWIRDALDPKPDFFCSTFDGAYRRLGRGLQPDR